MKVLFLTKYSRMGASSRMRSFQYFPFLEESGMIITCKPLFSDKYLNKLYKGNSDIILVLKAYVKRFLILFTIYKYQRVIIEKELFPYLPPIFEWLIYRLGVKYVADYDDAIFHNYDRHPSPIVRKVLSNKIDIVMRFSYSVIAGNKYLADKADKAGARRVNIIPTVVDLDRYAVKSHNDRNPLIIGWIGTQSTFQKHLKSIHQVLSEIASNLPIEIHLVGIEEELGFGDKIKFVPWSEETEVEAILNFDIGIMPLIDSAWEKGKCSYKLIQYMACGLPVIASPVGMNSQVVVDENNGFLAQSKLEWVSSIRKLVHSKPMRILFGTRGRLLVENEFSLAAAQLKLKQILINGTT